MDNEYLEQSEANLFSIANSQEGFFTAKQAIAAGYKQTNHIYHVNAGHWQREHSGIFRLTNYPLSENSALITYSLWSRDRQEKVQGAYSHQTALSIFDLSDIMPAKLHMTVPRKFRKSTPIPNSLVLHYTDLDASDIEERVGFRVTRPIKTILDLCKSREVSVDIILQAYREASKQGLITQEEIRKYGDAILINLCSDEHLTEK